MDNNISTCNIVLTGMPGCGKSTLGIKAAEILNCDFIDLDREIERSNNKSIPEIFQIGGEKYFRQVETAALKKQLAHTPDKSLFKIIASGGGIITQKENLQLLKKAYVIFIDRPLEMIISDIDSSNRPLLSSNTKYDEINRLKNLYNNRYPIYKSNCNNIIENTQSQSYAIDNLVELIKTYIITR